MTTRRAGFTLAELMVALVLTLMVSGVTYQLLLNNQRVSRGQQEHVSLQDNVRSGALIIGTELREVGYDRLPAALNPALAALGAAGLARPDLVAFGSDSVRYKAMRGFGIVCDLDVGTSRVVLEAATLQLSRTPTLNDSLLLYVEDDPSTAADDTWMHAGITGLTTQNCPDGSAGSAIAVAFPGGITATTVFGLMAVGAPVRLFEEMVMRSYQSGGDTWLGMRSVTAGGVIEPVLGPLSGGAVAATAGLGLRWLDMNGNVTAVPANVRGVEVTLRGITDNPVHLNGTSHQGVDSLPLTAHVALRNALR